MPKTFNDHSFMRMALNEGQKGLGFTAPNPAVGCVIVNRSGVVVGRGYHAKAGEDHAEVAALKSLKDTSELEEATMYITLEPCASQGKTPSCAHALANLPLARVVFGCKDPNPTMTGGQKVLTDAGIVCEHLVSLNGECLELAEVFFCNQIFKRSFVHVKVGSSLDGQVALKSGESQWITGEASRNQVQILRGQTDAVLIGRGTFEEDNPRLNIRSDHFMGKKNSAVIIDPKGKVLKKLQGSRIIEDRPSDKVFVVVDKNTSLTTSQHCNVLPCELTPDGHLDLNHALQELLRQGIHSVLVEGGGHTISQFFHQHVVDRLSVFIAPMIVGAAGGRSWTNDLSIDHLKNAACLPNVKMTQVGSDYCFTSGIFSDAIGKAP